MTVGIIYLFKVMHIAISYIFVIQYLYTSKEYIVYGKFEMRIKGGRKEMNKQK
jgi:hypothetical protein